MFISCYKTGRHSQTIFAVQTEDGREARNIVASELAAMFSVLSLPQLLTHYNDCNEETFKRLCIAFAKQIGLPRHRWVEISYPFFVSVDWDTRHHHARRMLCQPRISDAEMAKLRQGWVLKELGLPSNPHEDVAPREGCIHNALFGFSASANAREAPLNEALARWSENHGGVDFFQYCIWREARTDSRLRIVLPEQFHPIPDKTPDLNSPAEHAVGTVKHEVREMLLSYDMHSDDIKSGRLYQQFIRDAVEERLRGDKGKHHVGGSVRKLPKIVKILAAEKGQPVELEHVFGTKVGEPVRAAGPKDRYIVDGTAGGWIADTRWT